MRALVRVIFFVGVFMCIAATVNAQSAEAGNKQGKQATETNTTNATTAQKKVSNSDNPAPPPSEKKNWAIRIKQGEKWYQLSLELAF